MASTEAKARRRAEAQKRLDNLSRQLADSLAVEVPDIRPSNRDPELARIQQVESICDLLEKVLNASGVETKEPETSDIPNLDGMTKAELLTVAEERGVEVNKSATKAEIIEAVKGE